MNALPVDRTDKSVPHSTCCVLLCNLCGLPYPLTPSGSNRDSCLELEEDIPSCDGCHTYVEREGFRRCRADACEFCDAEAEEEGGELTVAEFDAARRAYFAAHPDEEECETLEFRCMSEMPDRPALTADQKYCENCADVRCVHDKDCTEMLCVKRDHEVRRIVAAD